MREIKFRGVRKDTGKLVYGYYLKTDGGAQIFDGDYFHNVEPGSVAQFVAYDSNGAELYDDDTIALVDDTGLELESGTCELYSWVEDALIDGDLNGKGCKVVLK